MERNPSWWIHSSLACFSPYHKDVEFQKGVKKYWIRIIIFHYCCSRLWLMIQTKAGAKWSVTATDDTRLLRAKLWLWLQAWCDSSFSVQGSIQLPRFLFFSPFSLILIAAHYGGDICNVFPLLGFAYAKTIIVTAAAEEAGRIHSFKVRQHPGKIALLLKQLFPNKTGTVCPPEDHDNSALLL